MVSLVRRTWTTSSVHSGIVQRTKTTAPLGVEVRRYPQSDTGDVGGLSLRATEELICVLTEAAARMRAERGAAPGPRQRTG